MTTRIAGILVVALALTAAGAVSYAQGAGSEHAALQANFARWKQELSNWGRWGADDRMGALNLITPAVRRRAAGLVADGTSVSLAREESGKEAVDNPSPYKRTMTGIGADVLNLDFHGVYHTHFDSFAHVFDDGKAYNGYSPDEETVMREGGHARNSVADVRDGVFTRGILMDIPRLKGVPYLEPGTAVYPADLEAWEARAGVKVSAGDALLIRSGRWTRRAELGPWNVLDSVAGLDPSCIPWLRERDVALIASEAFVDMMPPQGGFGPRRSGRHAFPVHTFALTYLGIQLIDNADLDAVAEAAAARNRWEFLFTAAPLPLQGGTGSPLNPIATF